MTDAPVSASVFSWSEVFLLLQLLNLKVKKMTESVVLLSRTLPLFVERENKVIDTTFKLVTHLDDSLLLKSSRPIRCGEPFHMLVSLTYCFQKTLSLSSHTIKRAKILRCSSLRFRRILMLYIILFQTATMTSISSLSFCNYFIPFLTPASPSLV